MPRSITLNPRQQIVADIHSNLMANLGLSQGAALAAMTPFHDIDGEQPELAIALTPALRKWLAF